MYSFQLLFGIFFPLLILKEQPVDNTEKEEEKSDSSTNDNNSPGKEPEESQDSSGKDNNNPGKEHEPLRDSSDERLGEDQEKVNKKRVRNAFRRRVETINFSAWYSKLLPLWMFYQTPRVKLYCHSVSN